MNQSLLIEQQSNSQKFSLIFLISLIVFSFCFLVPSLGFAEETNATAEETNATTGTSNVTSSEINNGSIYDRDNANDSLAKGLETIVKWVGGIGGTAFVLAIMIIGLVIIFGSISAAKMRTVWMALISCIAGAFVFFSAYLIAPAISSIAGTAEFAYPLGVNFLEPMFVNVIQIFM